MINFATILSLLAPFVVLGILGLAGRRVLSRPAPTVSRRSGAASPAAVARVAAADESARRAAAERQFA